MGVGWGYLLPPLRVRSLGLPSPLHPICSWSGVGGREMETGKGRCCVPGLRITLVSPPPPLFREHLSSQPVSVQQWQLYQQHLVVWLRQRLRRYEWREKLSWVSRRGRISRILNTNPCSGGWLVLLGCGLCFRILPGHFCCGIYLNRWDLGNRKKKTSVNIC